MRRALFALACVATLRWLRHRRTKRPSAWAWLRCLRRQRHNPVRHILGGFRCADCGTAGADLEAMGFEGGGYVRPMRMTYGRERAEGFTRSAR